MLYIVGIQVTLTGSATTSPNAVTDEEADVLIKCVSCGLAFIDPMEDNVKHNEFLVLIFEILYFVIEV